MQVKNIYQYWHYVVIAIIIMIFLVGDYKKIESICTFVANKDLLLHDSYRMISTQFIHINIFHLFMNMATLIYLNNTLSKIQSPIYNFLIYCFGIGCVAISLYYLPIPGFTYIGNSGAVSALLGSIFINTLIKGKKQEKFKIVETTIVFIILSFIVPNVSQLMHISGLISGIVAQIVILLFIKNRIKFQQGIINR